jgi:ribosomal protection tetracycline resistance protein
LLRTLNLGILAHVDAGKTSLTERLLYAAGVIDALGRVDDGSTQTDTLALERQRGITIKAAVVSFTIGDVTVNLIDTPGHPDFIAEVERVLSVLDGAVLVVSAVEGVQAQTRVLMRTLQRLQIPTLIFVNKIDRRGADPERVLAAISERLTPATIPMGAVHQAGTRSASVTPYGPADHHFTTRLAELLADHDDRLLAAYVEETAALPYGRLRRELAVQAGRALVHPVFFGSAITGAGVEAISTGIAELLPTTRHDPDGPVSGAVFKIERGPAGEKIAFVRMFSGTIRMRDRLQARSDGERKVTAIGVFERGAVVRRGAVSAGEIGKLWGLGDVKIGDTLGIAPARSMQHHFAPPTLESAIVPCRASEKGLLHAALAQLAEQDPLIDLRQDDVRQELYVSLYGEIQKEVIQATLAGEYGIEVEFRETTTICIERPVSTGAAVEYLGKNGNPFCATVGLRIEPAPPGTGLQFHLEAPLASLPLYVYKSLDELRETMSETVRETLREGLYGWRVTDCTVTMTHSGYISPSSTAGDFRKLTPLVLMAALQQAGTAVCEPIHRFRLEIPADALGAIMSALVRLAGVLTGQEVHPSTYMLVGEIPADRVHQLQQRVPGLTRGEGVLETAFTRYTPVSGTPPTRPRTDHNPLNRKEYLLHVTRRV